MTLQQSNTAFTRAAGDPPLLELVKVSKRYPGVLALDRMEFTLEPGEVHVLFGENGAGKSTMISIIAGATQPTEGTVLMKGYPVSVGSVHEARALGITTVFQEFSLVQSMSVEENMFLGSELTKGGLLDKRAARTACREILDRLAFDLDPRQIVSTLSRAEQQMVEIARAFRADLSVLILDEPTASLTDKETDRLFELVAQVKARGVGIIYITHRMQEIDRIADRITILRDGQFVATVDARKANSEDLLRLMTGRVVGQVFPDIETNPGEVKLSLDKLSTVSRSVQGASISVRAGEIVGFAGLIGSGKSEVIRAAFGLERLANGRVLLGEEDVTGSSPRQLLRKGFMYLPGDRKAEGLMMVRPCRENVTLAALDEIVGPTGLLRRSFEATASNRILKQMELHPFAPETAVERFSGGNQQKVLLGRSLTRPLSVYAFDEPTVGVDVGTRVAIYRFIQSLCDAGAAIILISSDLPEITNLCHRAYVFAGGRVQAELGKEGLTEENVLPHFFARRSHH
ncbi:sugar ABC transporter ATP-binding protein [Tardiphaga sp.]|uniref:sugar ABC transporter ATP-binding protein n=1 Tax=Tardiphaga sp. TaxID=1926292 RepID=UPI002608FD07|nr:sugar ABC transporter ATP-binding protein [Tardiphaga sp.]MDB5620383.1 rbsA2 [Tardiphaga sp.]